MPVILHHGPPPPLLPFEERIRRSCMEGCLVIVPTKRRIRHLSRVILRMSPGAVAPALPLHTMESLCRALYATVPGARPIISGAARTLLFHRSAQAVSPALRYFRMRAEGKENANLPRGTFDRLIDTITRLKESGIYHDLLEEELVLAGAEEQPKLADVAAIYAAYEHECTATHVEDLEGIYRYLSLIHPQHEFVASFRRLFPDVETVSLAGFDEFSVPEVNIIRKLCTVPGLSVTMLFDFVKGNPELFGHLEENYRLLLELGFREVTGDDEAAASAFFFGCAKKPAPARRAAEQFASTLFAHGMAGPRLDLKGCVSVMAARSRVHEVELICKLIKRLLAQKPGRDLGSICVALHHPQLYTDVMREQFARYDIPVNITDRFDLSRSPLVIALLNVLSVPSRGFQRDDVLRTVSSPYVRIPVDDSPFDAGNLAAVALQVRATFGFDRWCTKIDRALTRADAALRDAADEMASRAAAETLRRLRKARADLAALEESVRPFMRVMTAAEFEQQVLLLAQRLGVYRTLIDSRVRELPELMEKDIRAFTSLCDTLRDVTAVARLEDGADTPRPVLVHLERLKVAIGQERYNIREQFGRGVLVTAIEETRELPVEVMIVAGLVDGEFPSVYQPEVFLSSRRRKRRELRHRWENRYLFYQAVTNWTEHLYITYPLRDGENELVRSSFIDALLKSAQASLWEHVEEIPFSADIGARDDFLQWFNAQSINDGPAPAIPPGLEVACAEILEAGRVERSRTVDHAKREYEGFIAEKLPTAERDYLHALRDRVFSVSQLEAYAACPFRFLAQVILRLHDPGQFEEGFTALEKGALLHAALYEFHLRRRERGLPPVRRASQSEFEEALGELLAIAAEKLGALDIPDVFWEIEKELILGREGSTEGVLRLYLDCERNRTDDLQPAYFEVSFGGTPGGRSSSDPLLTRDAPVRFGGAQLRGKIDRVELGDGHFAIVDYKTGQILPRLKEMRQGMSLQLPVYLHATEELLRETGHRDLLPAAAFYYRLRSAVELLPAIVAKEFGGKVFPAESASRQLVDDVDAVRAVMGETGRAIGTIIEGMIGGNFPLTRPELVPKVCGYCSFRTVCRIQTMKHVTPEGPEEA